MLNWRNAVEHDLKIENALYKGKFSNKNAQFVDNFIITLSDSDSVSSDSSSKSDLE